MRKRLMWPVLLLKRQFLRPVFLVLLLLIPLLTLGYTAAARDSSGIITVALAGPEAERLAQQLSQNSIMRYVACESPARARTLVQNGKAHMAWIVAPDAEARLQAFSRRPSAENAPMTVVVREDTASLQLAREKLSAQLYTDLCRRVYLQYIRTQVPELAEQPDEALLEYFFHADVASELFTFENGASGPPLHYLTSPLRGLLAVLVLLCGLAGALYHQAERRRGCFGWLTGKSRTLVELCDQLTALLPMGLAVVCALQLSGLSAGFGYELGTMALYCLLCALFSMALRRLFGRFLAVALPPLAVLCLTVCPVFFSLPLPGAVQLALPPTAFLLSLHEPAALLWLAVLSLAWALAYLALGWAKKE